MRLDEARLDDADALADGDSHEVLRALATAGAQVREAVTLAQEAGAASLGTADRPRSVLVASLGGSALVGDVLSLLAGPGSPVPVSIRRNLPLPGWVGPLDLVVAVSLSGRAAGPLALAAEAARRGATLLTVGADDSPLASVTRQARGTHVAVGRGRTSSRTALWSLLVPVLVAADSLGLVEAPASAFAATADRLDEVAEAARPSSESFVNPAKVLAVELSGSVPVVLGDGDLAGVAAQRAAAQLSRTARTPAVWGELPDDASQVVAAFDGPFTAGGSGGSADDDVFADPFLDGAPGPRLRLLLLRDAVPEAMTPEAAATLRLADAVKMTAEDAGVRVSEHVALQGHALARLSGLVALTDFASAYLALGQGFDPAISAHLADLREATG
ncbi:MAG: SIS domain-containing protein [Actinomycetales bacterium]